jgi:hypothetical protein
MADIGALAEALLDQAAPCAFEFVLRQFAGPDRLGRNIPFFVSIFSPEQAGVARSHDLPFAYGRTGAPDKANRRADSAQAAMPE